MLTALAPLIPSQLTEFLRLATSHGFVVTLVGGAVRDLLRGETQIHDWDFELSHKTGSPERWKSFLKALSEDYRLEAASHHVQRAWSGAFEFQFAPPRVELYASKDAYAHGDFESSVAWSIDFPEAAKRRDFTLNALGARYENKAWVLVDPFDGVEHLQAGVLVPCDPLSFTKDPVRFLRAHRFAMKLNLKFSSELSDLLEHMDLSFLSSHYVSEEARKSLMPFRFWNSLQAQPTLPVKFQGGVLNPDGLQAIYLAQLPGVGFANALLAAVFAIGEGWHLLLPLAGKGENETTLWRQRRDLILGLSRLTAESFSSEDEVVLADERFHRLCQLTRPPLVWWGVPWVRDFFLSQGLEWVLTKTWDEGLDLKAYPPAERQGRKVLAWLRS